MLAKPFQSPGKENPQRQLTWEGPSPETQGRTQFLSGGGLVPVTDQPLGWEAAAWPLWSVPVTLRSTFVRDLSTSSSDSVSMNSDSSPAMKPQSTWLALLERSGAGPGPPHPDRLCCGQWLHQCGLKALGPLTRGLQGQNSQGTKMVPAVSTVEGWWGQLSLAQSGTLYQVLTLLLLFIKPCMEKKKKPTRWAGGNRAYHVDPGLAAGVSTPGSSANTSHK